MATHEKINKALTVFRSILNAVMVVFILLFIGKVFYEHYALGIDPTAFQGFFLAATAIFMALQNKSL